jgi:beta-N-acetylhexosaminidase
MIAFPGRTIRLTTVLSLAIMACATAPEPVRPPSVQEPPVSASGPELAERPPEPGKERSGPTSLPTPQPGELPPDESDAGVILVPDELEARALIRHMSRRRRIAQRFVSWVPGKEISPRAENLVSAGVGGIILSGLNIESSDQVRLLTTDLQAAAASASPPVGLFVGVDQEGGRVTRFRLEGMTRLPAPYYWGLLNDTNYMRAVGYVTALEIAALGCNMNLAPVLDLYDKPDRTIIGDRALGNDPRRVGELGRAYIEGARSAGVIAVAKHFPGHGESTTDSHSNLPVADASATELTTGALEPFRVVIRAGAEAIMTAHVLYTDLDPDWPATMSRRIVADLLRRDMGFDGIVVSDAIEMGALVGHHTMQEILKRTIEADVDLILVGGTYDVLELIALVEEMVAAGELDMATVDRGVLRILDMKIRYGLAGPDGPAKAPQRG